MAALPESAAPTVVDEQADAQVIGQVADGEQTVAIRGLELRD